MTNIEIRHPDGTTALLTSRAHKSGVTKAEQSIFHSSYGGDNRKKCHALNLPLGRPNRRLREDLYP